MSWHGAARRRPAAMPAAAALAVVAVLGVQLAHGGGDFAPVRTADPCVERAMGPVASGIDPLTERLVLLALDAAACRLHTGREALTLELAETGVVTDRQVAALHTGLVEAVDLLEERDLLPPASELADEALDASDLNVLIRLAVRALPDPVIDAALATDDVLRRTVDGLDLRRLLDDLNDTALVEERVSAAVTQAVRDALVARLRELL